MSGLGKCLRHSAVLVAVAVLFAVAAAYADATPLGYVANPGTGTVSVFNPRTNKVVGESIPVGSGAGPLAVTPDGATVYVTEGPEDSITAIDAATRARTPISVPGEPDGLAISPDGKLVYVGLDSGGVALVSTATDELAGKLATSGSSATPAVSPDGSLVYVPRKANGEGSIEIFDTQTRQAVGSIVIPEESHGLVFTPDGSQAYFIADEAGGDEVWVIDTALRMVVKKIPVAEAPQAIAIAPDGRRAYVVLDPDESVAVIDTGTNEVIGSIPIGRRADAIAIAPDGKTAFVAGENSEEVTVIDLATGRKAAAFSIPGAPDAIVIAPDQSPTAAFTAPSAVAALAAPFSGAASSDPDGTIALWNWSFGDGGVASGVNVSHAYGAAGTYGAKLSVVDDEGCGEATVFTGQSAYCSGNVGAAVTHQVSVGPPASGPVATPTPTPVPAPPANACPRPVRISAVVHNRRNGTARVLVKVPGSGSLYLFGKKVHAVDRRSVGIGSTFLTLHARVEVNKRLKQVPHIGIRIRLTFFPAEGCSPTTVHRSLALSRAPRKKPGRR